MGAIPQPVATLLQTVNAGLRRAMPDEQCFERVPENLKLGAGEGVRLLCVQRHILPVDDAPEALSAKVPNQMGVPAALPGFVK